MAGRNTNARTLVAVALCAFLLLMGGTAWAEEQTYVFDPVLSLTGGCQTTTADPVPDPAEPECPSVEGDHPVVPFYHPRSAATDIAGDIYVPNMDGVGGIDIFNSKGLLINELTGSQSGLEGMAVEDIAVDGEGHLYVYGFRPETVVLRLDPDPEQYDPANGKIGYEKPITILTGADGLALQANSIAVDSADHLYVSLERVFDPHINIYGSAAEDNVLLKANVGKGILHNSKWLTVDSRNGDIYVSGNEGEGTSSVIKVLNGADDYSLKRTIKGFSSGSISAAVDEETGRVLVGDLEVKRKIFVFPPSEGNQTATESLSVIQHEFQSPYESRIAVDNGVSSPNRGYLFVPSQSTGSAPPDHVYAFAPILVSPPPVVTSARVVNITETEAHLEAVIDPGSGGAEFRLEYVSEVQFDESGFGDATVASAGQLPPGKGGVTVSAAVSGLAPATAYRVRAVAENHCEPEESETVCSDEAETGFMTYPATLDPQSCPNGELRSGFSAHLPDCRAYELVTPPDTGGRPPETVGISPGDLFATPSATAGGGNVSFVVGAGGIPGLGGAGAPYGEGYLAERSASGWQTKFVGPTGTQLTGPDAGGLSPDHGFSAWSRLGSGSGELFIEGGVHYIRYPDGSFHLVGRGSQGEDPRAKAKKITEGGGHMIFESEVQLEPNAPPTGATAIYDRTRDPLTGEEETHVISLLPEDEPQGEGEDAIYEGASADGEAVAYKVGNAAASVLYVRVENDETLVAALPPGAQFAGISDDHRYVFYFLAGDLYRFAARTSEIEQMTASGDALFVNVSPDGSHAYFVSPSILTGEEENSQGDKAIEGEENLYVWDEEGTRFIGTVTERDVEGGTVGNNVKADGLGLWASAASTGRAAIDPSRTTVDGTAFVFESRARLTAYDSEGKAEIYRYEALSGDLRCLSCNPTGSTPGGDAGLLSVGTNFSDAPVKTYAWVPNLRSDGRRVFFESPDPLVVRDTNETQDVYEWEEDGVGSCEEEGGCVYLISSGHSPRPSYLYGVSASGDDVFFMTTDLLAGADHDETPSIYDARVEGGFPESQKQECEGEGCRPPLTPAPSLPPQEPSAPKSTEKPKSKTTRPCPKGKRKVRRHGKRICVRVRHGHHKRHPGSRK